jgi:hypothetical protein
MDDSAKLLNQYERLYTHALQVEKKINKLIASLANPSRAEMNSPSTLNTEPKHTVSGQ